MYKLLIVDDEEEVRQGIIKKIDWQSYGFSVSGEAENGREALEIIEENIPDVMITDISMPLMDGMELTEQVSKNYPTIKTIILTGFDEFNLAQKAVKYGVSDYILKPILPNDIKELLIKLKEQIDAEIAEKEDKEKLRQHYKESLPVLRSNFIISLISGNPDAEKISEKINSFDIRISGDFYFAAVISIAGGKNCCDDSDLCAFAVLNIANEIMDKHELGEVFMHDNSIVIAGAIAGDSRTVAAAKVMAILEEIRQNVEKYLKVVVTIGLGSLAASAIRIKESYRFANAALDYRLVAGENKVISYDDMEPEMKEALVFDEEKEHTLLNSIKFGSISDIKRVTNDLVDLISEKNSSVKDSQIYFIEIFSSLLKLARAFGLSVADILPDNSAVHVKVNNFESLNDAKEWLNGICIRLNENIIKKRLNNTQIILEKAKEYIQKNYGDSNLSIQKLANELYISQSYLSLIFKKEAGISFLKYLIKIRLEEAKKMLGDPSIKMTEIAEKIGYSDISYFSYFFKKNFGSSPREYRRQIQNNEEPSD